MFSKNYTFFIKSVFFNGKLFFYKNRLRKIVTMCLNAKYLKQYNLKQSSWTFNFFVLINCLF